MVRVINPLDDIVPPVFGGFPEGGLKFLRTLKRNNNREWFMAHKHEYEGNVKEPMENLLAALGMRLREKIPDIDIDLKKSIYRIYRDIRFSPDKTPYKTHIGASFTVAGRDRKTDPGYYFHIAPDEIILAGGAYNPPPDQLKQIRKTIDTDYQSLRSIINAKSFKEHFERLDGETLSRTPRDYQAGHPAEDLLKMKQLYCWAWMEPSVALDEDFTEILADYLIAMSPLVRWLLNATK